MKSRILKCQESLTPVTSSIITFCVMPLVALLLLMASAVCLCAWPFLPLLTYYWRKHDTHLPEDKKPSAPVG